MWWLLLHKVVRAFISHLRMPLIQSSPNRAGQAVLKSEATSLDTRRSMHAVQLQVAQRQQLAEAAATPRSVDVHAAETPDVRCRTDPDRFCLRFCKCRYGNFDAFNDILTSKPVDGAGRV